MREQPGLVEDLQIKKKEAEVLVSPGTTVVLPVAFAPKPEQLVVAAKLAVPARVPENSAIPATLLAKITGESLAELGLVDPKGKKDASYEARLACGETKL